MDTLTPHRSLVTTAEAAAMLTISRQTVRRWGEAGHIAAVRLGPNTVRYRTASIESLLQGDDSSSGHIAEASDVRD